MPILVLTVGLVSTFHPMLLSGFRHLQTDPGDCRFIHYVLEHTYRWSRGDELHRSLWDPPFFHPHRNVLAYGDTLLSVAPAYWAFRAVGASVNASFGLWMMAMSVLNFAAALALIRVGFARSWPAASLGAFLIAFGSSRMVHLGHPQLVPQFYTFLALLVLVRLFRNDASATQRGRRLGWAAFFGCCVAQLYAGYYNAYFLFLILLIAGLLSLPVPAWRRRLGATLWADARWITGGAMVSVLASAPLAWHYWLAFKEVGGRTREGFQYGMARPDSYLWMGPLHWLYGWTADWSSVGRIPWTWEHAVGLGLATTIVTLVFLWRQRHCRAICLWTAVIAVCLVLFTRTEHFNGFGAPLYDILPGIQGIRVMARLAILLLVPAGLAVAFLADGGKSQRTRVMSVALALFCCAEQINERWGYDAVERDAVVARIERAIPEGSAAFYLANPELDEGPLAQLDAMWASLLKGVPTVNGYSGVFPSGFPPLLFESFEQPDQRQPQRAALAEWTERHAAEFEQVAWIEMPSPEQVASHQAQSRSGDIR
jgi:hypothetical protein